MICQETYGSGATIGLTKIITFKPPPKTPQAQKQAKNALFAVAGGQHPTQIWPIEEAKNPTKPIHHSAFGAPKQQNNNTDS